jgi:hypothetical protein
VRQDRRTCANRTASLVVRSASNNISANHNKLGQWVGRLCGRHIPRRHKDKHILEYVLVMLPVSTQTTLLCRRHIHWAGLGSTHAYSFYASSRHTPHQVQLSFIRYPTPCRGRSSNPPPHSCSTTLKLHCQASMFSRGLSKKLSQRRKLGDVVASFLGTSVASSEPHVI